MRKQPSRAPTAADALIALNASSLSRASVCRLGAELGSWLDAPRDDDDRIGAALGVPRRTLARARGTLRDAPAVADDQRGRAASRSARIVTLLDTDYPPALRELALPPPVLYCRGTPPIALAGGTTGVAAIVGSRRPSTYAREAAWLFGRELARAGAIVVSGFARGVDAAAHRGALAGGGMTVAVLGCGIDVAYPLDHHPDLAAEVAASGVLVSELPLGAPPRKAHFPIRNRVIAALARATLVVEGAIRSGSLITARCALDLGRDVLAVPGRIFDDGAMGTNALLADGARPALSPRDLLDEIGIATRGDASSVDPPPLPGLGARLWEALPPGAMIGADELAARCVASIDATLAELLELELAGWIARLPGPVYTRRG
jgi:DNA processing protein